MIRRPPRSTRTDTLFPTRRSSDLIRAGFRFGEALTPDGLALRHRRDVALLLLLAAEQHQRRADPVDVHVLAAARLAGHPHFFGKNERRPRVGVAAAPACRPVRHQQRSEEHTYEMKSLMRNPNDEL